MDLDPQRRNVKTTVYLDSDVYQKLKGLAAAEGRAAAELVREAVAEYARRRTSRLRPRSIGSGRSTNGTVAEHSEELLDGFGRDE